MDAGVNWYEAQAQLDIYVDQTGVLDFQITPLTGGNPRTVQLYLEDLEKRPRGTTRLHINMTLNAVDEVYIRVQDLGFGEIFPATNQVWEQVIEL